jgi:hypothetical protein
MSTEMQVLLITAIGIACLHTVLGPDHYIPFIALSKSRGWSFGKTLLWTVVCGCGHVWSSVLLGLGGAAAGWSLSKIAFFENVRGNLSGWFLLLFGLLYGIWGLIRAFQNRVHKHFDSYADGSIYVYEHKHGEAVLPKERYKVTPWVLFIIFLLGPCEPMIPLLFFPAAQNSLTGMVMLVIVYTFFTLLIMVVMVVLGYYGITIFKTAKLEKYMHALGGLMLFICGAGMIWLSW